MSFLKKLDKLLLEAKKENVLDANACEELQKFAIKNNSKSSVNIFISIIGLIGAIAIVAGLILVISHNWWKISNSIKIFTYILTLIMFHIVGVLLNNKYPKVSSTLHFIGAGYVLAGIGLMAQIYHLSSTDGKAFLMWFIMIAPMAVVLRHRWIGIMSLFSFYLWLNIYLGYYGYYKSSINSLFYYTIFATNLIVLSKLFTNNYFSSIKGFGAVIIAIILALMGFNHEMRVYNRGLSFHWLIIVLALFNFVGLLYFLVKEQRKKINFGFDTGTSVLLMITILLPLFITRENLMLISVLYWILHFLFGALLIYQGGLKVNTTYINCGVWYIVLGIFLRFIDIAGTMLSSGLMFILFGIILLALAFLAEKFRKKLISKIQQKSNA